MREDRFYSILTADSPVNTAVSGRIFWDIAEQGTAAPYIILTLVSGVPDDELAGGSAFESLRCQVDCYATTKAAAIALGQLVRAAIEQHGYLSGFNPAPYERDSALYRDSADYELLEFTP